MPPWMMRPTITVIMYIPSCLATTSKSLMAMIFPQIRQAIPRGEYLQNIKEKKEKALKRTFWDSELKLAGPSSVPYPEEKPFTFLHKSFAKRGPWNSTDAMFYFRLTAFSEICSMDLVSSALMGNPKANFIAQVIVRQSTDELYHPLGMHQAKGWETHRLWNWEPCLISLFHSSFL